MSKLFLVFTLLLSTNVSAQERTEPFWWSLERDGKYLEAIEYLTEKIATDSTRNKHADYLHIARFYGYLNDYENAIHFWKKCNEVLESNDPQWTWYYRGTLAFFERNKAVLKKNLDSLESNHTRYYEKNYRTLKSLYENFEKGYLEASRWR